MRMSILSASILLITTAAVPVSLSAQRVNGLRVGLSNRSSKESVTPVVVRRDVAPTHWKEGMIVGGVIGLAVGAAANSFEKALSDDAFRPYSYSTLFISMGLFAVIGGLIGSASHK
jgi:hypothetical protein